MNMYITKRNKNIKKTAYILKILHAEKKLIENTFTKTSIFIVASQDWAYVTL